MLHADSEAGKVDSSDSELATFLDRISASLNDCRDEEPRATQSTALNHQFFLPELDSGLLHNDKEDDEAFQAASELLDELYDMGSGLGECLSQPTVPSTARYDASSTSASDPEETAVEEAAGANPKRRQRVTSKQRIDKLRETVAELTHTLQSLGSGRTGGQTGPTGRECNPLWQNIAARQLERRLEAERDNAKLRAMLEIQVQEAKNLRRVLKRRTRVESLEVTMALLLADDGEDARYEKQKTLAIDSTKDSVGILQEMLRSIDITYVDVDRQFQAQAMEHVPCPGKTRRADRHVLNDIYLEVLEKQLVPFPAKKTVKAVWGALGQVGMQALQCVKDVNAQVDFYLQNSHETEDTMMISYALASSGFRGSEVQTIRVRKVMRKYVEENRTVFVCRLESLPERVRIEQCCCIRVVVERADALGGHNEDVMLVKSHYSVSRHASLSDNLPHGNVDMAIAVWDETISRVSGDIESLLLNEAYKTVAL